MLNTYLKIFVSICAASLIMFFVSFDQATASSNEFYSCGQTGDWDTIQWFESDCSTTNSAPGGGSRYIDIGGGGTVFLNTSLSPGDGETLTVNSGSTLTIRGVEINNSGTITNNGIINMDGTGISIVNNATFTNTGTIYIGNESSFTNNGSLGVLTNSGAIYNDGTFTNSASSVWTEGPVVVTNSNGNTTNNNPTSYAITGTEGSSISEYDLNGTNNSANYNAVRSHTGTSWSGSGLPDGISVDSSTGVISGTPSSQGQGTFYVTSTGSSATQAVSYSFASSDATPPTVTNITSDKANGSYTVGEAIDIDVTFSEAVTSTGNVTVTLETGSTDRTCTFTISNSTAGTCNYTVQSGDTSSDLTVSSISGTVQDAALNSMTSPTTPTTNLAANKALVIDTSTPPSTSITSPTTGQTVSNPTTVTGSCETGATVSVSNANITPNPITGTCSGGTYSIPVTWNGGTTGSQTLSVTQTDPAGNTSSAATVNVTVDLVGSAPGTPDLQAASDTGSSSTDNTTSDTTPTFNISCTSGATVEIREGTAVLAPGTCTGGTVAMTASPALSDGLHSVTARQNTGGGFSPDSPALSVTVDTAGAIISSVASVSITTAGTTITWNTDENTDTLVEYGLNSSYTSSSTYSSILATSHSVPLSGLTAGITYHYRVISVDASGNRINGSDQTFTTTAASSGDSGGGGGGGSIGRTGGSSSPMPTAAPTLPSIASQPLPPPGSLNKGKSNNDAYTPKVCTPYLTSYIKLGSSNSKTEVEKLERFLNTYEGEKLAVNGIYERSDFEAVNRFQEKYNETLSFWNLTKPTGYVYIATQKAINRRFCEETKKLSCPYFETYHKEGDVSVEVLKIKKFLNETQGEKLTINQSYDSLTTSAIRRFQSKYASKVLYPWNLRASTGRWYQSSRKTANDILGCFAPQRLDNSKVLE